MVYTVSITSQGQISIPAKIRKLLGFSNSSTALISVKDGKMLVEPVKDFLSLGGSLKTNKKPLSSEKMDEMFADYMAKQAMGEKV